MSLSIGKKIGGGFALVIIMLLIAGMSGYNGISSLGNVITYFSTTAWSSNSNASLLSSSIQAQASLVDLYTSSPTEINNSQQEQLTQFNSKAEQALDGLTHSEAVDTSTVNSLKEQFETYQTSKNRYLKAHQNYVDKRNAAFSELSRFEEFMKVLDFYANNINRLPNIDADDKFELAVSFFKTKINLQTRFYFIQRLLGGENNDEIRDQLEGAFEELDEEASELSDLDLVDAEIRSGTFAGKTYGDHLLAFIETHETSFTTLIESFDKFIIAKKEYADVKDSILKFTSKSTEKISDSIVQEVQSSDKTIQSSYLALFVTIFIGAVIGILVTIFCALTVIKPIVEVGNRMKDIASGEGDLTQELPIKGKDEITYLSRYFNEFISKIRGIVKETIESTERLRTSAMDLNDLSNKTSTAADGQQNEMQQIATALCEMMASFQEVATNAANAEEIANNANDNVNESKETVESNRESINQLAQEINVAKEVITQLVEESNSVADILNVIKGISDQTNLLALNAAIEAARAGEYGRGFAVVADEVRSLAQKTKESTDEVHEVIAGLNEKSANAIQVISNSVVKTDESVNVANTVTDKLNKVTESVYKVLESNTQISVASEEQVSVVEDINKNVTHINELIEETANNTKDELRSIEDMTNIVQNISDLVNQFKV